MSTDGEPVKRVRGSRLVVFVLGGSLLLGLAGLYVWRKSFQHPGSVEFSCHPADDRTATCEFKLAEGGKPGRLCFTMVLDCRTGMHSARVCSGTVPEGKVVSVHVPTFEPPLAADASCQPPRYLDRQHTRD